jgi:hypothetical protein
MWSVAAPQVVAPYLPTGSALLVDAQGAVVVTAMPAGTVAQQSIQGAPAGSLLTTLYAGQPYFADNDLATDDGSVYFSGAEYGPSYQSGGPATPTGVVAVPRAGGATTLVSKRIAVGPLLSSGSTLITFASDPHYYVPSLLSIPKAGGVESYLYVPPNQDVLHGVALDGPSLYVIEEGPLDVAAQTAPELVKTMATGATGGARQIGALMLDASEDITAFAAQGGAAAFVVTTGPYGQGGNPKDGLYVVTSASTLPKLVDPDATTPMLLDGGNVYYAAGGALKKLSIATAAATTLTYTADSTPLTNVTAFGGDLYVATQQCIVKLPE